MSTPVARPRGPTWRAAMKQSKQIGALYAAWRRADGSGRGGS
jgi:hypothetical protein